MTELRTRARAKINLCLFVGPPRGDGRHEVVTLMDSLDLGDDLCLEIGRSTRTSHTSCARTLGAP